MSEKNPYNPITEPASHKWWEEKPEKLVTVRMKSSPSIYWNFIKPEQWSALTDKEQDVLIEAAKIIMPLTSYNALEWPNQKVIITENHGRP